MKTRTTTTFLLLLLLAAIGVRAQGSQFTFIQQVADTIRADAGIETQITVILKNHLRSSIHLSLRVQGDPGFSIDSLNQVVDIDSGFNAIQMVRFQSNTGGTFSTLLTVTDGTVTDSVMLFAIVNSTPFVLLPPAHNLYADLGEPMQFSVEIRNLSPGQITVNLTLSGDTGFTMMGSTPVVIPGNGSYTVVLVFLANSVSNYSARLTADDGNFSTTSEIYVDIIDSPYKWITTANNHNITRAGQASQLFVTLRNTSGTPVSLNTSLTGDPAFRIDSTAQSIIVDNYAVLFISFVSDVVGRHSTLLSVTDGVTIDTLTLDVLVTPGIGGYTVTPSNASIRVTAQEAGITKFHIRNLADIPLTVTASLNGDWQFLLDQSQPMVVPGDATVDLNVHFTGAAVGIYRTTLALADGGTRVDSLPVTAIVSAPDGGNELFVTEPLDGRTLTFNAPPGGTDIENVSIRNLRGSRIVVTVGIVSDSSFVPNTTTVTIDSGFTATVAVTFSNPPLGRAYGHLILESGDERAVINLLGETNSWSDYSGLRVMNYLDFGGVDTNTQYCRDVWLINTTADTIGISNVQLTGFAPDFSITSATSFNLPATDSIAVRICYTPTSLVLIDNDILTFTVDNPSANPHMGTVAVNITGRSFTVPPPVLDSTRMFVFDVATMIAPINGFVEKTIVLQNIADRSVTLNNLSPLQSQVFSLLTSLPIVLPAYDPAIAGSGTSSIRVRYAPTSTTSSPNVDDLHVVRLYSLDSQFTASYSIALHGKPVQAIPGSGIIALYPENGLPPVIALGEPALHSTSVLHFRNNLTVPVSITSCNLEAGSYAEIVGTDALPATIQPGAEISITLRITREVQELTADAIIMRGSHEHLNARYELYNGNLTTGIEPQPVRTNGFAVQVAPNPSNGNVAIFLNETLRNGRIRILDVLGRSVTEFESAAKTVNWNATSNGLRVPVGSYFIHVSGIDVRGNQVSALHTIVLLP